MKGALLFVQRLPADGDWMDPVARAFYGERVLLAIYAWLQQTIHQAVQAFRNPDGKKWCFGQMIVPGRFPGATAGENPVHLPFWTLQGDLLENAA